MSRARTWTIALASPATVYAASTSGWILERLAHPRGGHPPLAEQRDEGLRLPAEAAGVDERRVAAEDAVGLEPVDAPLDRGRAQRDLLADALEGAPGVLAEQRDDLPVDVVHRSPEAYFAQPCAR